VRGGEVFFKYRSYSPIPLIVAALILAMPTWFRFGAGFLLMLLGETIRFWGVAYAGSATRTTGGVGGKRLVTDGPFGYVRNPLYVGNFFLSFGALIMSWAWMPWMVLVLIFLFGIQYSFIVHLEEGYLSRQFGKSYRDYQTNVPRWIPRMRAYSSPEKSVPNYPKALRSERNTFQAILTVCGLLLIRWHLL